MKIQLRCSVAAIAVALLAVVAGALALTPADAAPVAQDDGWLTYSSEDAAYAFDYPPDAILTTSEDAALPYKIVYVQFPVTDTENYQGASVMVLENPRNQVLSEFILRQYGAEGVRPPAAARRGVVLHVNGRPAMRLQRDPVVGDNDATTVLIRGDGVVYRLNLYGGGDGGPVEPSRQAKAIFDRLMKSFDILGQPLVPKDVLTLPQTEAAEAPVADVFTYPLRSTSSVAYGIPTGIVINGTHMEWLGYGIRNLDQWRIKCYGVDWTRMIHTGEDWYRLDGANTAGTPVYAVADGVVARHNPGISYPGNVVMIRHRLPDGRDIYSMYGHVANVSVVQGQVVRRGQQIATVIGQSYVGRTPSQHPSNDSHLHFEMRTFLDGTNIYVPATNAYGYNYPACTYAYPGRGYTYIIHPDDYPYPDAGYINPSEFIKARLGEPPPVCTPVELVVNGNFEKGVPGAPWMATNSSNRNDPLIYKTRRHAGAWGGWLGNVVNYTDTLAQQVNVPAGSTTLTLTFWRQARSAEPAGNADDRMVALLSTPGGQVIGSPLVLTSATTRNAWVKETVTLSLAGYTGPATLSFTGFNDGNKASSFFIDDVSLAQSCP